MFHLTEWALSGPCLYTHSLTNIFISHREWLWWVGMIHAIKRTFIGLFIDIRTYICSRKFILWIHKLWLTVCETYDYPYKIHCWFTYYHLRTLSSFRLRDFPKPIARYYKFNKSWTMVDILIVDNCSEVDIAGNFYKQDGKYYDDCCDLENENAPESSTDDYDWSGIGWFILIIITFIVLSWFCVKFATLYNRFGFSSWIFRYYSLSWIFRCFWDCLKNCYNKCYNTCCEPQPIVRNDNNATRNGTERSNISTISDNYIQSLVDRLPRSRASEDLCTGQSKYFFWNS